MLPIKQDDLPATHTSDCGLENGVILEMAEKIKDLILNQVTWLQSDLFFVFVIAV